MTKSKERRGEERKVVVVGITHPRLLYLWMRGWISEEADLGAKRPSQTKAIVSFQDVLTVQAE
jgi:hypothetical protein